MISLTMAFWASSYSSLLLVYSSFRELSLLQTWGEEKGGIKNPRGQARQLMNREGSSRSDPPTCDTDLFVKRTPFF